MLSIFLSRSGLLVRSRLCDSFILHGALEVNDSFMTHGARVYSDSLFPIDAVIIQGSFSHYDAFSSHDSIKGSCVLAFGSALLAWCPRRKRPDAILHFYCKLARSKKLDR